ncbi:MAG: cache domain-containing protein [Hyphomicrobium sp.]
MIRHLTIALTLTAVLAWPVPLTAAGETATPQDVIAKVKEAAAYLEKNGKSGLKAFDSADSPFVWKDTYALVFDCAAGLADVGHPASTTKEQKIATNKDATGRVIGPELCEAAARPGGGWVEYMWWKPVKAEGTKQLAYAKKISRKVTYMLNVKGQPYQVGAGVYNDTLTVKDLNALLKQ